MSVFDITMFYTVFMNRENLLKLVFIFLSILFIQIDCFALTLEGGVSYTEETARKEAFEGVYKINPLAIYLAHEKRYFFDINATSNGKLIGKSKALIFGLIPYHAYHVVYENEPDKEFLYEKRNGKYQLFATIDMSERNKPYPQRFIKYDKYGHLMNIEFTTGYESFIFDKDGNLLAHWEGCTETIKSHHVNAKCIIYYK